MRIGYIFVDLKKEETKEQRALFQKSLVSVRRHMPDVEVVHLTDYETPDLAGVDEVMRFPYGGDMVKKHNRADCQAECEGDWLFLDTDTLILRDVSSVFDKKFDIAVADRPDTWSGSRDYFNQGVVFSRCQEFWRDVAERAREWGHYDENVFTAAILSGRYDVLRLPATYNYHPINDVAIYHFKGRRKKQMLAL